MKKVFVYWEGITIISFVKDLLFPNNRKHYLSYYLNWVCLCIRYFVWINTKKSKWFHIFRIWFDWSFDCEIFYDLLRSDDFCCLSFTEELMLNYVTKMLISTKFRNWFIAILIRYIHKIVFNTWRKNQKILFASI